MRIITKEFVEKIQTTQFDYNTCSSCGAKQTNIDFNGRDFMAVWCNNGCDTHGDIYLSPNKKLAKKVKQYLLEQFK